MALVTPSEAVGANVRAEMARRHVSQATVAVCLGLTQTSVSRRLAGTTPFDVNELTAVAELLDVGLDVLLQPMDIPA